MENKPENTSAQTEKSKDLFGMAENTYCMVLHLSQLASFIVPMAGVIAPIVLWVTNKDKNKKVNEHGKNIMNWMISCLIYGVVSGILVLAFGLGILLLSALGICAVVFAIIGGLKANKGEVWKYPLTITFLK